MVDDEKIYSILINTCDAYRDAWPMFFYLLKENWSGEIPKVYINTETEQYRDDELDVLNLNHKNTIEWGDRLLRCLDEIKEKYILMMLEDFYYENPIKTELILKCVDYMEADKNIMAFEMVPCGKESEKPELLKQGPYAGFAERKRFSTFKVVACPTLWRKSDLLRITMKEDNPWEWEYFGSFRTWFYNKKIFSWISKTDCIFDYDIDHGGAIHRGKWVGYKMKELEEKFDYKLDYEEREIEYDWMKNPEANVVPPIHKRLGSVFHNRTKMACEIIRGMFL